VDGVHPQQQEQRRGFELTGNAEHAITVASARKSCN
jgi:hypothetical protein